MLQTPPSPDILFCSETLRNLSMENQGIDHRLFKSLSRRAVAKARKVQQGVQQRGHVQCKVIVTVLRVLVIKKS